jgi:aspartyl-tRNA(Asn)/glutamyl-tRNA(Gln) amidotransferase subunit C
MTLGMSGLVVQIPNAGKFSLPRDSMQRQTLCYPWTMREGVTRQLTSDEIRDLARLARLHLSDAAVERSRQDLSRILEYLAMLSEVDVSRVEPMSHPLDLHSRMDRDETADALPHAALARLAPVTCGRHIAVPRVLETPGEGA